MRAIPEQKIARIRQLRTQGFSIPEISHELDQSKSTVFRYIQGVEIAPIYRKRWLDRRNASKIISTRNWIAARIKAERAVSELSDKELTLIGVSLYWAEGAKKDFMFSNTDPEMIRVFLAILRKIFRVKDDDIKISLRIYEDLDRNACLKYWSMITGAELDQDTSIDILRGSKNGKLKYGMCRVRVKKGGLLLKEFSAIMGRMIGLISPHSLRG